MYDNNPYFSDPLALVICIDMGKSTNKVTYSVKPKWSKKLLLVEPEVATLSPERIQSFSKTNCRPIDDAWCEFEDGSGMAFGLLATQKKHQLQSVNGKKELKFEKGALRVFAIISAIAQEEKLGRKFFEHRTRKEFIGIKVALSVLLPLSEYYSHRDSVRAELEKLKEGTLKFRGTKYGIFFDTLDIKPEAAGLLMIRQAEPKLAPFKQRNLLCLLMGHYNITGIVYERGQMLRSDCPSLGFHQVVDSVVDSTCLDSTNISEARLSEAIYLGDKKPKLIRGFLIKMLRDEASLNLEQEKTLLAIEQAKKEYWLKIRHWLISLLEEKSGALEEVLISGGASELFSTELKEFFTGNSDATVVFNGGHRTKSAIQKSFNLRGNTGQIARLVDCFGIHQALQEKVVKSEEIAS
jgi:hypothetical protein